MASCAKSKKVVGRTNVIQSVDSLRLAQAIAAEAQRQNIVQDILFEVNIGCEESKSGVLPEELWELADKTAAMESIRIRGLMAIPPALCTPDGSRVYFARMRQLQDKLTAQGYPRALPDILSMGMSGSYYEAILEGSNLVRIGTAIYGARDYGNKI